MPELPEVEYTARQLRASVVGATIREAEVFWERTIKHPALPDFLAQIAGRTIENVRRRGKFLIIDLSGELFLSVHRRMTGNFLLLQPGWTVDTSLQERDQAAWNTKGPTYHASSEAIEGHETKYCRVSLLFEDGRCLLFTDPRKFGTIGLWAQSQETEAFRGLGPEPLGADFTAEGLQCSLVGRRTAIKQLLLDQTIVAGVGNIYADEALFYASLHPLRRADSLSASEIALLHEGIVTVLTRGIEHGGTSFNSYRDLWGEAGENFNHVQVYQQDGKPCVRCGTLIERIVIAQRSAHFCPGCQPKTLAEAILAASEL
ncbi:bifunctional DNA-formamidopyrimidine glycosylase/DNA-(apurinic or apyrimidinic site) lyase [Tengunoibacter tsumagoiensis]|uniref:Formamidopyrimidine-DNA glycosylase n=1 Tax=Tengunoibacter tsumagoiensis TaxID=2014871 RepID=A0A402A3H4_9CHLR|nr:bifunctional DNA-formamidopyrimidine glycosylase/DNA-(apurinic or apyrimidinic site) lyase [Tengunoibacter tsumagoiensis]GCE13541.1 formamidopyrimidine-DNA glycosylase [Tengunoibacter tsumagoiensis]